MNTKTIAAVLRGFLIAIACSVASWASAGAAEAKALEIYFIDVEGGQSTLLVTPDKHTLLIDTGWAGDGSGYRPGNPHQARDANRIVAAARDAGVSQIDYLLITHFHTDHDGGVSELAQLMPIRGFIDHGAPHPHAAETSSETSSETRDAFAAYSMLRSKAARHIEPRPGDRLPLDDLDVIVVSSGGATLPAPLPGAGATNSACQVRGIPAGDPDENPRSTGVLVRYGKFRFLDVGDLSGEPLFNLACPRSSIGPVEAYLVPHHGGTDVADPATFSAFQPRVAIMNNGPRKGGALATFQALHHVPGLEGVWQLHTAVGAGDSNFPAQYIANVDESTAHWIKLVADQDGSFRVFNGRTGEWKDYPAR